MELDKDFYIPTNEYQTEITKQLIDSLPEEVAEQLLDYINTVPYIQNLISPSRKRAKDLPRDNKGKIIVNLENPHILENMDYFRPAAIHYKVHGCYTFLRPNPNPNSEYRKWIDEEKRRCREGYIRESDGEWVTGYMYWYMNYCPIMLTKITEGTKKANRVEDLPETWEGIYLRFHYIDQARESGKHAIELAKRGAHPYTEKVFTPQGWKLWKDIKVGDGLFDTKGNITKVIDIPYDREAPYYRITLGDGREVMASDDHLWVIYEGHKTYKQLLSTKELLVKYKKQKKSSDRILSGIEYDCFITKNNGVELPYRDTLIDPYTFGLLLGGGYFKYESCYYTQAEKDINEERNYIPYPITKWSSKCTYRIGITNWKQIISSYNLYYIKSEDKFIPDEYKYNSKKVRLSILKGLFDSDGYIHGGVPTLSTTSERLKNDVMEIARSLGYNVSETKQKIGYKYKEVYKGCLPVYIISVYADSEIFNLYRKKCKVLYNNNAISRRDRTSIINIEYLGITQCKCVTVDSEDSCYLIGDFITTHNCSKSYSIASMLAKNLILGENSEVHKRVTSILTAHKKEYLADKDGTLSKFEPMINFIAENTEFPRLRLRSSSQDMFWQMGYIDSYGRKKGSLNSVMGVSSKDDSEKLRGKRGYIFFEEMGSFSNLLEVYDIVRHGMEEGDYVYGLAYLVGCVCKGTKLNKLNGEEICIENLHTGDSIIGFDRNKRILTEEFISNPIYPVPTDCYKITLSNNTIIKCSWDHPILTAVKHIPVINSNKLEYSYFSYEWKLAKDITNRDRVCVSRVVGVFGSETLSDLHTIINQLIKNKIKIPDNYQRLDKETVSVLLSGLYNNIGDILFENETGVLKLYHPDKQILKCIRLLWRKFGVLGSIQRIQKNPERLKKSKDMFMLVSSGKENLIRALKVLDFQDNTKKLCASNILEFYKNKDGKVIYDPEIVLYNPIKTEFIGTENVYHLTTDNTHTYLANGIITHNTAAEKESSFESAKTLLYNPNGNKLYAIKNVYDKVSQGKSEFGYFFPAYLNRKGCYNENGVSDVIKALLEILIARYNAKYNSTDPNQVLRLIGEMPITPAEAIIKVKQSFFPVIELSDRLQQINLDPKAFDDIAIGTLIQSSNGDIKFVPGGTPIRHYGEDNTTVGAIEFYEMPKKDSSGQIPSGRYIIGHDPVDNDQAVSTSLSSTFVFDLFTDRIVAEYTGRHQFADDNFETVRLLCLFYNAKCLYESNRKGIFAYFNSKNCLYLLAETPPYLRDMQIIKYSAFGSNKYGVNASNAINGYANDRIKTWLKREVTVIRKDEKGGEIQVQIPQLYTICSTALLEELIGFDQVRNFDRVRALGMVMLYREGKIIENGGNFIEKNVKKMYGSNLSKDDFFTRNYDNR